MFQRTKQYRPQEGLQFTKEELEALPKPERESVEKALEWQGQGFDIRVCIAEPKSGFLLKYQPYRRHVINGEVNYFRRDANGVERRYSEQGHLIEGPSHNRGEAPKHQHKNAAATA